MNDELYYYLGFSHFNGIGPMRFLMLLTYFKTAKKAYTAKQSELEKTIGVNWTKKFIQFRELFNPRQKYNECVEKNIQVIPFYSDKFPKSLKEISDPPICLYVKGNLALLKSISSDSEYIRTIAIVGTRLPTPYGQQIARKFSTELTEAGFVIVSGMALGIDAIGHWAALNNNGKTIAVLGCGVDMIYPTVNKHLYDQIMNKKGVVLSEFPPGQYALKGMFVARNRIISALSNGVLIVEGLKDSGSLITARYAAEQGKCVFAPPCPITSAMSEAPNLLLKQGARLVTSVEDIYEELNLKILPAKEQKIEITLSAKEKNIFDLLKKENSLVIDEIAQQLNSSIDEILNIVSIMEIKGIIEKNSEGKYQIIT